MTRRDCRWMGAVAVVVACAGTVRGQAAGGGAEAGGSIAPPQVMPVEPAAPATRPGGGTGGATGGAGAAGGNVLPSAESVLKDLLQERSGGGMGGAARPEGTTAGAATQPGTAAGQGLAMENGILREGEALHRRSGRLERQEGGVTMFVFDEGANGGAALPAMQIVPSKRLWALEEAVAGGAKQFRIDRAEVTQYRGKNYLYIRDMENVPQPAATGPSRVPAVEAVAPNEPAAVRLREGQSVYNRVGRLVKDERHGGMLFVFDSDGKQMYDPPMGVIPCRNLVVMEERSEAGAKAVKFRVSGEITQYRGKNYFYPKVVQVVRDLNQGLGG